MQLLIKTKRSMKSMMLAIAVGATIIVMTNATYAADMGIGEQDYTFALVTHGQSGDTFWDRIRKGAATAAKQHDIRLIYVHGQSPSEQASKLENVITQGVDAIALTLAFPEAMKPLVRQARQANIPIVGVNAGFNAWQSMPGILMYIGQDERLAGQAVGQRLNMKGAKKAVCVNQMQGAVQLSARCNGIADTFEGKIETLFLQGYDMSTARSRIVAKLIQDPTIDAIVTLGAPFAPVALDAIQKADSDAIGVTFGITPRTAGLIKAGKVAWTVDVQPFLQGYEAVELLWLYKVNGDMLGGGKAVLTGPAFVDADNVEQIMPYVRRGTR